MSSTVSKDPITMPIPDSKPKRKRKPKKKGGNATGATDNATNTLAAVESPIENITNPLDPAGDSDDSEIEPSPEESDARRTDTTTDTSVDEEAVTALSNGTASLSTSDEPSDAAQRFEALVRGRDALRMEVTQLRQSLEELQAKHQNELESVQGQLQESQGEREQAEEQYQNLLGKVNTIRSQLGERLKADAEDLAQARTRIEELEDQKTTLQEQYTAKSAECEELTSKHAIQSKELSGLRNRATLSQQNWIKEREELIESEAHIRGEFEDTRQAMHDWEVLAMEERSMRNDLTYKVSDLEEQVTSLKEAYERASSERESQSGTVDGLQRALQEIQTARKKELRELVESSQSELESLRKLLQESQTKADIANTELESTKKELERALPFEKEVKEKNLLIGKLRHEAVILNDHLTKALRFLKKGKPEDNVDRQIVTNHFLHFLALDRSDAKKFQVLQLIAALLGWTEEQREQAGLARPGGPSGASSSNSIFGTGSLRLPLSPSMHRTPSTPALTSYFDAPEGSPATKESLADLWQNFLEQEAGVGKGGAGGRKSRAGSTSTTTATTASTSKP